MEQQDSRLEGITEEKEEEVPQETVQDEQLLEDESETVEVTIENEGIITGLTTAGSDRPSSASSDGSDSEPTFIGRGGPRDKTKEIIELFYQEMRMYERQQRLQKAQKGAEENSSPTSTKGMDKALAVKRRGNSAKKAKIMDSDDADTDLEGEKEIRPTRYNDDMQNLYDKACKAKKVVPMGQFKYQIQYNHVIRITQLGLSSDEIIPMCVSLVRMNDLSKVDFSGNRMGMKGLKYLLQLVKSTPSLTDVNISDNALDGKAAEMLQIELDEVRHIKKLNLSKNNFTQKDADSLAELLRNVVSLRTLILSHNDIGEEGGVAIGRCLGENSTLDNLSLSWCNINRKGAHAIANAMKENSNLDTLDLAWNGFSNDGAKAMAEALKINTTLTSLNMAANRIGPVGILELAKMLAANEYLEYLNVDMNPLTTRGADELIVQAKKNENSRLKQLDVGSISVTYDIASLLDPTAAVEHEDHEPQPTMLLRCDSFVRTNNFLVSEQCIEDLNDSANLKSDAYNTLKLYAKTQNIQLERMLRELLEEPEDRDVLSVEEVKRLLHRIPLPISDKRKDDLVDQMPINEDGFIEIRRFFQTIDKEQTFLYRTRTMQTEQTSID